MRQKLLSALLFLLIFGALPVPADELSEQDSSSAPQVQNISENIPEQKPIIIPPKWTEFCEMGYENAVYKDSNDIFNIFSFVKSERVKKNYWAERRVSFEKYLKSCNSLNDDAKSACYDKLRTIENEKNDLYKIKRNQLLYENNIDLQRR